MKRLAKTLAMLSFIIYCSCGGGGGSVGESPTVDPQTDASDGPPAGNPAGHYPVPAEAAAEDVSSPDRLVGPPANFEIREASTSRRPNTKCSTGPSSTEPIQSDSQNRVSTETGAIHPLAQA